MFFVSPDSLNGKDAGNPEINLRNLGGYYAVDTMFSRPQDLDTRIGFNPNIRIAVTTESMKKEVLAKISSMGLPEKEKKAFIDFIGNWRHYRYAEKLLRGELNYEEIKTRLGQETDAKKSGEEEK